MTMKRTTVDLWVGVVVTAGIVALLVLALKVGNATSVS
ncbi:MAG TPA: outer membrane lipid asymmetry maintenance protein MlaD, partial [Burkholderiales bacterium]|nr:outer membrane lipid asymmetry maintenance protein MlaD [Burkholderiales bacterium]